MEAGSRRGQLGVWSKGRQPGVIVTGTSLTRPRPAQCIRSPASAALKMIPSTMAATRLKG